MACQGTSSAPRQVGDTFISVVFADMPAPIGNPHPVTHPDQAESLKRAISQVESGNLLGLSFGIARLQQETRSKSQEKSGECAF